MSKMISIRLHEKLLARLDQERRRIGLTRAAAIIDALQLWIGKRQYEEAVLRDQQGYDRLPIAKDEFEPILKTQRWPK